MLHTGSKLVSTCSRGFADAISGKVRGRAAGRALVSFLALAAAAPQVQAEIVLVPAFETYDTAARNPDNGTFLFDANAILAGTVPTADGTDNLNYIAVYFRPTITQNLSVFGQNRADADTAMLFYEGAFAPTAPRTGLLALNDDVDEAIHPIIPGVSGVACGPINQGAADWCPQVIADVTAGSIYSLVITNKFGDPVSRNMSFYTNAFGEFATSPTGFSTLVASGIQNPIANPRRAVSLTADDFFNGGFLALDGDVSENLGVAGTGGTIVVSAVVVPTISGDLTDHNGTTGLLRIVGGTTGPDEVHFTLPIRLCPVERP